MKRVSDPSAVWRPLEAAEAMHRINDWYRRGYVMFSDMYTKSTHLRRVPAETKETARPRR